MAFASLLRRPSRAKQSIAYIHNCNRSITFAFVSDRLHSAAVRIRTPKDLGSAIRVRRRALGLDQAGLATRAGVSRLWVNQVEAGKPGASLGLVLRTLSALGMELEASERAETTPRSRGTDIDAILARARSKP
jgi:y4mF family transcriptional regulator